MQGYKRVKRLLRTNKSVTALEMFRKYNIFGLWEIVEAIRQETGWHIEREVQPRRIVYKLVD